MKSIFYFSVFLLFISNLNAAINLIKKENNDSNTTLLVIGGIHGNEPGGYFAPAVLATHYTIKTKNLWIVPNLNQESIIHFTRGIHGDMNRKFSYIKKHDKDKKIVEEIKKIILSKNVSLVLNLHDGHGFYRKDNEGSIFNPNAWGQTCVIDQCRLKECQQYGNLNDIAITIKDNINKKLLQKHHSFNVKNTKTKYEDEEMKLSLTYFAVTHNKPAFAIETSKNLSSLSQKVFYQLVAIEEYMKIMGIDYSRDFDLNQDSIAKIIKSYGTLEINHNILLNLCDIKKSLSYIPIKSKSNEFNFSNPLGEIRKVKGRYLVYIANKLLTRLKPQYFKLSDNCQATYEMEVDGKKVLAPKASEIFVNDDFKISKSNSYRVNVIGFYKKGKSDESDIRISYRDLNKKYSVDKQKKVYRVEFYKKNKFCSMIMVHFK
ncbi:M99 family carboxypeptidase catalytic domain-containing protein [Sulfurimonas sp.]|uniref:M99 family carboxypeptidase catalytic domain-containing protein n=1 Tax=Sulfurimonas sp. TaxID=2022749 RepID=UPI00260F17C7|nr:M99 family carboxypeptidase catalytic domain-containing protein [Sulfurimonas sp.]